MTNAKGGASKKNLWAKQD